MPSFVYPMELMLFSKIKNLTSKVLTCRCDVCVGGPPKIQNLKEEAAIFLRVVKAEYMGVNAVYGESSNRNFLERPNFKTLVGKIRRRVSC